MYSTNKYITTLGQQRPHAAWHWHVTYMVYGSCTLPGERTEVAHNNVHARALTTHTNSICTVMCVRTLVRRRRRRLWCRNLNTFSRYSRTPSLGVYHTASANN